MIQVCSTKFGAKVNGLVASKTLQKMPKRSEHPVSWYYCLFSSQADVSNLSIFATGMEAQSWA